MLQITHCLHTAFLVSDLAQAEHFYGTVLGLTKVERPFNYPGAWYQIGPVQLHLIADVTIPHRLHNSQKFGGNHHVAFAVTNLTAAKEHLLAHGYPIQMSASGRAALFTHDPDGNVIELSQV